MRRHGPTVIAVAVWTALILVFLQFRGAGVGGPACRTNPQCDDPIALIEIIFWAIGTSLIIAIASPRRQSE